MKNWFLLFLFISHFNLLSQEKITEGVLFIGTFGVGENEKIKYFLESEKITWINPYDTIFSITNDTSLIKSELETTGNSSNEPSSWKCWFAAKSSFEPQIAYGLYKFSNSKNSNLYFYLDTRDCRWGGSLSTGYNPDIFIKINFQSNSLSYSGDAKNWTTFLPGSILKVWEIKNEGSPETKYFEPPSVKEFSISNNNNFHPVLNWNCEEFYTNFNIERKLSDGNWIQIGQTSETQFIDEDITWSGGNNPLTIQYRIWTVNSNLISFNSSPIKSITIDPELQKKSNSKSAQFVTINFDTTEVERVLNIDFDKNYNIWITLNVVSKYLALVKYDGINWYSWKVSEIFDVYPNNHFVVAIDSSNLIWLYILGKGLVSFDGNDFNIHYSSSSPIVKYPRMTIDKYNNKWIFGPVSSGLFKIDSIDNYFLYTTSNSPLPSNNGGIIYLDGDSLWICTYKGIVKLYNNEWQIFDSTNTKMPSQQIFSFAKDLNSMRWLGTRNLGLLKWINDSTFLVFNSNNAPFLNDFVNVITVDKFNNLWIGTDNGLLKYDGTNFTLIEQTINHSIVDVKIDTFNNKWIASYYSSDDWGLAIYNENGVYGINLPTNVNNESYIDKKFVLYQNYPNPFNSKTKIKFSIPLSGFTSLTIYDLLGQEVATLVNETKQIGEHEIDFDADKYNLSSGVYIYQLKNNSLVQSKKFILMK